MSNLSQPFRLGPDGEVNHLEVSEEPQTKQHVIYWGDIRRVYRKALHVKNGPMIVSLARNHHGQCCEPDCIKHYPGVTLEVVEDKDSGAQAPSAPVATSLATASSAASVAAHAPDTAIAKSLCSVSTDSPLTIESLAIHAPTAANALSTATAVPASIRKTMVVSHTPVSHRLLQRTQSMLQESSDQLVRYEQSLQTGQTVQADAIMHGMQAMRKDIQEEFRVLHSEVAKSDELKELRQLVQDMKTVADVQTRRIVELQELSVKLQQEALDRLALIQNKVTAIMTQSYELHEYPIPRLFIVLPKEDTTRTERLGRGIKNLFTKQFKLYFLCECGDHTKPVDGQVTNPNLKHEIHIARHEGYDIERPTEFFDKYGSYILTLLQMLKFGVAIAGVIVPPLGQLQIVDSLEDVAEGINHVLNDIGSSIDSSIAYLEGLTGVQGQPPSSEQNSSSMSATLTGLEALEGADLRQLHSFLHTSDEGRVLGNLYRIVTTEGHVKWVCLDHYRENYRAKAAKDLRDAVQEVGGEYNERVGRIKVQLSTPIVARRFYAVLGSSRSVQELDVVLEWSPSMQDLRELRDIIKSTNIFNVRIVDNFDNAPLSDVLNRGRRYDPILQMMTGRNIQTFSMEVWEFLDRVSTIPATLHVRHLKIESSGNWSKRIPRLVKILQACPLLLEVTLRLYNMSSILDPLVAAMSTYTPVQGLRLRTEDESSYAVVEFEARTGKIQSVDLKVSFWEETELFNHPLARNLALYGNLSLSGVLRRFQACLKKNVGLESVELGCLAADFYEWYEAFRDLFASYPQQTPRFILRDKWTHHGSLIANNIRDCSTIKFALQDIEINDLTSGFLSRWPEDCSINVDVLRLDEKTDVSAIEYLQLLLTSRRQHLLISTLSLDIEGNEGLTNASLSPRGLEVLKSLLTVCSPEVRIHLCDYYPQDISGRFIAQHATHIIFRQDSDIKEHVEVNKEPYCRLKTLRVERLRMGNVTDVRELDWMLPMICRTLACSEGVEHAGDRTIKKDRLGLDHRGDSMPDEQKATSNSQPQPWRLNDLTLFSCILADALWSQIVQSIDVLTLRTLTIYYCSSFTSSHLAEIVTRCISAKDEVVPSPSAQKNVSKPLALSQPSDPWALQDLKSRKHQHLVISLKYTDVSDSSIVAMKARLQDNGIDWVQIELQAY